MNGCTHALVAVVHVLSGRRTWEEHACRRCGKLWFLNFR